VLDIHSSVNWPLITGFPWRWPVTCWCGWNRWSEFREIPLPCWLLV